MPVVAEAALRLFARRLLARAAKGDDGPLLRAVALQEPVLARHLRDAVLTAYLTSARATARPVLSAAVAAGPAGPPLRPPFGPDPVGVAGDEPPVRFPAIEAAARWLESRRLVTPEEFVALDAQARRAAFTVARAASIDTVRQVRDATARATREGRTLAEYREDVRGAVEESSLSAAHVETLYRTQVGQAQAAGKRAVLTHPMVADEFPYLLFSATHDLRTRPTHLAMEKHGQNGTAVYRADDPIWETLWPPMEWNCRCDVIPLSIEDAARHGSKEAARWLRTGTPPAQPEWARVPYPVQPPEGWPDHRGVAAVV